MRAHQGSGWQKSPEQFEVYGAAVAQYGELQLEGVQRGDLRARDLSSARMLLRGVIKQVQTIPWNIKCFCLWFFLWRLMRLRDRFGAKCRQIRMSREL